jgi:hypothetical protein
MGLADIPSGPATIAPLVWTIGHLTMCLIVDSTALPDPEHTQAMLSAFYHAKTVSPPMWFLGINLALLLLGLLGNFGSLVNFFFAKCSLKRRALELLGVVLFVCNVALNIVHVMPLEKSVASLSRTVTSELGMLFSI